MEGCRAKESKDKSKTKEIEKCAIRKIVYSYLKKCAGEYYN